MIAEVNIIGIAVYSSIDLYAQLLLLAKLRTKRSRPSFSAGAVPSAVVHPSVNLHLIAYGCA